MGIGPRLCGLPKECVTREVRRIHLLRASVNKGKKDRGLVVRPQLRVPVESVGASTYIGWAAGPCLITLTRFPRIRISVQVKLFLLLVSENQLGLSAVARSL